MLLGRRIVHVFREESIFNFQVIFWNKIGELSIQFFGLPVNNYSYVQKYVYTHDLLISVCASIATDK